jgi:hypothetical protein
MYISLWKFKIKGKNVKMFLCLNNQAPCHEEEPRNGVIASPFLTSAQDTNGQLHAPAALAPGKEPPVPIV